MNWSSVEAGVLGDDAYNFETCWLKDTKLSMKECNEKHIGVCGAYTPCSISYAMVAIATRLKEGIIILNMFNLARFW